MTVDTASPTVEGLCQQWLPLAIRYTRGAAGQHPHLDSEFQSAAGYALLRIARWYVTKGMELWAKMPFPCALKIAIARACQGVVAKEITRHPVGFILDPADPDCITDTRQTAAEEREAHEEVESNVARVVELFAVTDAEDLELVLRHYIDGESLSAMGRELGVTPGTVWKRVQRVLSLLRCSAAGDTEAIEREAKRRAAAERSAEKRKQVRALSDKGLSVSAVARECGVCRRTAAKYLGEIEGART
jgi:hypothetical protein